MARLEDLDGIKLRVMQNNVYIDTFKTLGSNAVPMAFSEVYSALETKTVDGQENPFNNIENMKFYEVMSQIVLTSHLGWPADLTYSTMAQAAVGIIEAYLDGRLAGAANPDALRHRKGTQTVR